MTATFEQLSSGAITNDVDDTNENNKTLNVGLVAGGASIVVIGSFIALMIFRRH